MTEHKSRTNQGELNPNAHFTEEEVRGIRRQARRPNNPWGWQAALARKHGVTRAAIAQIVTGERYPNVED